MHRFLPRPGILEPVAGGGIEIAGKLRKHGAHHDRNMQCFLPEARFKGIADIIASIRNRGPHEALARFLVEADICAVRRGGELRIGHVFQFRNTGGIQTQLFQQHFCQALVLFPHAGSRARVHDAALDDGSVVEPIRSGHLQKRGDLAAAPGLAEDRHIVGIPAESGNILFHPFQRFDDIRHADIPRERILFAVRGQVQIA